MAYRVKWKENNQPTSKYFHTRIKADKFAKKMSIKYGMAEIEKIVYND